MPNPKTTERLRSLVLSATDLGDMTDWPEALIEDYLNTLDNLITIADLLDIEIDKLIEETPTDFAVGSIPFKGDEFLVEDNTNLTWDNGTKVLTMANALVLGLLTALNVVVTGLLTAADAVITGVLTLSNTGLHILDTDASHDLIIKPGSDLTADRTYTITTGDSDRTITLQGNPLLDDWFDQPVKSTSGVIFNMVGIGTTSPSEKLDVNGDAIRIRSPQTPATAAATGTAGMICWDASYIYVCVATNTWKRTALATW